MTLISGVTDAISGVADAIVTSIDDPEGLSRVKLTLPWLEGGAETEWVRVMAPFGAEALVPAVGDEVLVAFHLGDVRYPYVLGRLPNRQSP